MKNYNGIYAASNIPDHITSAKSPTSSLSMHRSRASLQVDDPFTVQVEPYFQISSHHLLKDLRHEYNRALNYIDKLKYEQNNLKDSLKMTLDHKRAYPSAENLSNSFQKSSTLQNKPKGIREGGKNTLELELENNDLKSQLDTALIRIAKLQREKHTLQEKIDESESSKHPNVELLGEIRTLTHEIKVLTTRMQELEEENKALLKHKAPVNQRKGSHSRDQNLSTYFNYMLKLISSTSKSSFARSCFDERFASVNIVELLDLSQFEPVLLKSFKYITDLLININSMYNEEEHLKSSKVTNFTNNVYSEHQTTRHSHNHQPQSSCEDSARRENLYQEYHDIISPQSTEITPIMKQSRNREDTNTHKASRRPSDAGQSRGALQKIVAPPEETHNHKSKHHTRNHSSIVGSSSRLHDSHALDNERATSYIKKDPHRRDSKHGAASYLEESGDYSSYSRRRGDPDETDRYDVDGVQKCVTIVNKAKKEGKYPQDYDDIENEPPKPQNEPKGRHKLETGGSEKSLRKSHQRPRAIVIDSRHNEADQSAEDTTKRPHSSYSRQGKLSQGDLSSVQRKDSYYDEQSRSDSEEREIMHELEEHNGYAKKGHRREDSQELRKPKVESHVHLSVAEPASRSRSRSIHEVQDTIHETHESKENEERSEKRSRNRKKERRDQEEDDEEAPEQQQMWEKKREELARMTRKTGSVTSNASELKGREYPTFRVSFGRTESKSALSPSPERQMVNTIIDVPRKKRVDHRMTKFDLITGGDASITGYYSPKVEVNKPTGKFYFQEERRKTVDKGVGSKNIRSQKSLSNIERTGNESEIDPSVEGDK